MSTISNTYHTTLPMYGYPGNTGTDLLAVLTTDAQGLKAVYVGGWEPCDTESECYQPLRQRAAEWIAAHGEKQGYQRALNYFPDLKEEEYRA